MKAIIGFFIFCLVLFLYLHIQYHLKTSDDLEIYELDQPSKDSLEEICDIRQPILFEFEGSDKIVQTTNIDYISNHYHAFEVKIRNVDDNDINSELYVPLPLHSTIKLFNEDKNSTYYSENNNDFLKETSAFKNFQYNDEFLRPYMVSNCNYDIMFGSNGSYTPLRYEINYRNFFLLTQGSAQVKLIPPKDSKYLSYIKDYENFEFRSQINPWNVQSQYKADFDKIKCLEISLLPGKTLFIPPFWWYSIKFNKNTSISCFRYRTYINNLAISPYIFMYMLQIQNVKRNVVKKIDINENINTHTNHLDNSEIDASEKQNIQTTNIDELPKID
jgi:hypothetical protein